MKRIFLGVVVLVLAGIGYFFVQPSGPGTKAAVTEPVPRPQQRPSPVVATTVAQRPMPVEIATLGTVQTMATVLVKSRIDGLIVRVPVTDGQDVKEGDVLFELDTRQAEAQLRQAEASAIRDQAQILNAQREVERKSALIANDWVSKKAAEDAKLALAVADATLKADQALVQNLKVQLSYATITAPIAGRLGMIQSKVGSNVKANDVGSLLVINQIRPIYVSISVPQKSFAELRTAMIAGPVGVRAVIPGDPGPPEEGQVTFIDNAIDTTSGTVAVRATFPNRSERLWPGQFVNVVATLRMEPNALAVPSAAIQTGQDGTFVFVIKPDNTAEQRPVTIARSIGSDSVIAKGLAANEQVVLDGQLRLVNGSRVEIRPPTGQPPGNDATGAAKSS